MVDLFGGQYFRILLLIPNHLLGNMDQDREKVLKFHLQKNRLLNQKAFQNEILWALFRIHDNKFLMKNNLKPIKTL